MNKPILSFALGFILIAAATALAYFNTFDVPFIFDDYHNIADNPNIHLTELSSQSLHMAVNDNPTPRPVAYLTFALNYYFGNSDVWGYHLINNLIHLINGILVYCLIGSVLPRITQSEDLQSENFRFWIAITGALIFVLHPVQTQSVTYIVQRMTSMCTMFYFGGLLCYLRARTADTGVDKILWWSLVVLLWLLSLGTKQIAVTFPVAILLLEWILFNEGKRQWLQHHVVHVILVVVLMALVAYLFKGVDFFKLFTRGYSKRDFTLTERLLTEGRVIVHYISLIILPLPSRLTLLYDYPISTSLFAPATTFGSWLFIGASIVGSILFAHRFKLLCLATLWFFLHLVVESTFIPLEMVYEHRLYLPMFGVSLLLATGIFDFFQNKTVSIAFVAIVCLLLGYGSHVRNETWRSTQTIWEDNIRKSNDPRGFFNLGNVHARKGEYEKAMRMFNRSAKADPYLQAGYVAQGRIYELARNYDSALDAYDRAIAIARKDVNGIAAFDEAYAGRARIRLAQGKFDAALKAINQSIDSPPKKRIESYLTRAKIHAKMNRPLQSVADYQKAIEKEPDYVVAHNNLSWFLATHPDEKIADPKLAVHHGIKACELTNWADESAMATLATAYARAGDFENAIKWQTECLNRMPNHNKKFMRERLELFKRNEPLITEN